MSDKSPEAFRTISEVAEDLDLPQHVLRFWETRFSQIKPMKRGGGRRYYRPEDVNLLRGIRFLLYGEGYTIKGVQRILKEHGIRHVASIWQEAAQEDPAATPSGDDRPVQPPEAAPARQTPPPAPPSEFAPRPIPQRGPAGAPTVASAPVEVPSPVEALTPVEAPAPVESRPADAPITAATPPVAEAPAVAESSAPPPAPAAGSTPPSLSAEDVRHLKAALFELIECKRILDTARQTL